MSLNTSTPDPNGTAAKAKRALEDVAAKGKAGLKTAEAKAHDLAIVSKDKTKAAAAKAGAQAKAHPVATALAVVGVAGLAFMLLNRNSRTRVVKGAGLALGVAKRRGMDGAVDMADWAKRKAKKLRSAA